MNDETLKARQRERDDISIYVLLMAATMLDNGEPLLAGYLSVIAESIQDGTFVDVLNGTATIGASNVGVTQ